MPGITPARKHARWISLATLLAYLGVLTLVAFGHRCVASDALSPQGDCSTAAPHDPSVEAAYPAASDHACLACALTQQTASPCLSAAIIGAPAVEAAASVPHPVLLVRHADLPAAPLRGPPHA